MSSAPPPQHFLHSYFSNPPEASLQSFARQGLAPFGHLTGTQPELLVPQPEIAPGPQPVYHLKVTATPIDLPKTLPPEGPEYEVTAYPTQHGSKETTAVQPGETAIVHATPKAAQGQAAGGLIIRPLNLKEKQSHQQPAAHEVAERGGPVQRSLSHQVVSTPAFGAADTLRDHGAAFVHVYGGASAVDTREVLKKLQPSQTALQTQLAYTTPPGGRAIQADEALGHMMSQSLDVPPFDDESQAKMYSWIIPTGGDVAASPSSVKFSAEGVSEEQRRREAQNLDRFFAQASEQLDTIERQNVNDRRINDENDRGGRQGGPQIVSTPTDDELNLPPQLRPSVVYGGVEHAPPEFAGFKGSRNYKLHAIEVHQYIPLPNSKDPWLLQSQMNPATTAIFGPMPMPFDPSHSGMVAPTFQRTINSQPVPMLSPEMARMFNHELTVVSQPSENQQQPQPTITSTGQA